MTEFSIGAVIVPARNGMLERLGHDVTALGAKALGVVTETRPSKCLVQFPDLSLSLWLDKDEIADAEAKALAGDAAFKKLLPDFGHLSGATPAVVWWIWMLSRTLPVTHILGIESGRLLDLWSESVNSLDDYYDGPKGVRAHYVGLGIDELRLKDWHRVERLLGETLLFARFLPAGMHKMEVALYLKAV